MSYSQCKKNNKAKDKSWGVWNGKKLHTKLEVSSFCIARMNMSTGKNSRKMIRSVFVTAVVKLCALEGRDDGRYEHLEREFLLFFAVPKLETRLGRGG